MAGTLWCSRWATKPASGLGVVAKPTMPESQTSENTESANPKGRPPVQRKPWFCWASPDSEGHIFPVNDDGGLRSWVGVMKEAGRPAASRCDSPRLAGLVAS